MRYRRLVLHPLSEHRQTDRQTDRTESCQRQWRNGIGSSTLSRVDVQSQMFQLVMFDLSLFLTSHIIFSTKNRMELGGPFGAKNRPKPPLSSRHSRLTPKEPLHSGAFRPVSGSEKTSLLANPQNARLVSRGSRRSVELLRR